MKLRVLVIGAIVALLTGCAGAGNWEQAQQYAAEYGAQYQAQQYAVALAQAQQRPQTVTVRLDPLQMQQMQAQQNLSNYKAY